MYNSNYWLLLLLTLFCQYMAANEQRNSSVTAKWKEEKEKKNNTKYELRKLGMLMSVFSSTMPVSQCGVRHVHRACAIVTVGQISGRQQFVCLHGTDTTVAHSLRPRCRVNCCSLLITFIHYPRRLRRSTAAPISRSLRHYCGRVC